MIFQEMHDHNFAYIVITYGMANLNQHEKRHARREQGQETLITLDILNSLP
jgi:hypothetical protein